MPARLERACSVSGCPGMDVAGGRGRCADHARQYERQRGNAAARGRDYHWTYIFRPRFSRMLIAAGIAPACGAALPGGPSMADSLCKAEGRLVAARLRLDHDPPLTAAERESKDRRVIEDPMRCGWLCESCHNRRTQRQQQAGIV